MPLKFLPGLLLAVMLGAPVAFAQPLDLPTPEKIDTDQPVSLDAGSLSYDRATDRYQAEGDVRLQQGALTLKADSITWDRTSGEAVATGAVRVESPDGIMESESLRYNLITGKGRLTNGRVFAPNQNFEIAGAEIEKLGALDFRVTDGTFTTCEGGRPDWKFAANRFDVTLGGYARARHVLFFIKDIPVLYVPYLFYPAKNERESGLLLPRYGYSTRRGTQFSLAWYQVIARNMDATLQLDYLSRFGLGKGVEYRYMVGEDSEGILHAYHVTEGGQDDRYALDGRHRGTLPGKIRLTADIDFVSSRDYYSDFGENYEVYTRDKAETVVYLGRNWDKLNLSGQFKYLKDLEQKSDFTLQRLPEVRLAAIRSRIGETPLFFQFDLEEDNFWRRTGEKGERLMLRPALSTNIFSNRWLNLVPEVGFLERLYQTSSGFDQKAIYDVGARASTQVGRVYSVGGKTVRRVRHNIEPEMTYQFVPRVEQDGLPDFDNFDRIDAVSRLGFALTNRFTARIEPENEDRYYHEFLYLRLSESYDFREADRILEFPGDSTRPFSPLLLEMIVRPNRWSYVDLDTSYDLNSGENRLVEFNLRGTLTDGTGNDFGIDYRNRRGELEYLAANLATSLLKPVYLNYLSRFDFKAGKALENVVGFEFRARCWSLLMNFRERPEEREIMISFALTGLGRVAGFGTTRPRHE